MAECIACRAEIASYDRRCWNCGAGVKRDTDKLFSGAPTNKELSRARLIHLLALPGMLILGSWVQSVVREIRTLGTDTAELANSVRILAAASGVTVRAPSRARGVQLPVAMDAADLCGLVLAR